MESADSVRYCKNRAGRRLARFFLSVARRGSLMHSFATKRYFCAASAAGHSCNSSTAIFSISPIMETSYQVPRGGSVGFDDVKVLIARGTYVDKSLFVKEIIDNTSGVLLITRPRRWGKSSNMSLLKTFLELEVIRKVIPCLRHRRQILYTLLGGCLKPRMQSLHHAPINPIVFKECTIHGTA